MSSLNRPLIISVLALGGCVLAAVHHAGMLALRVGELFGSIILAVAVTVIEVGLIVSIMLSGAAGSETVARDTVFSAIMIVLNGEIGLSLVLGAQASRAGVPGQRDIGGAWRARHARRAPQRLSHSAHPLQ